MNVQSRCLVAAPAALVPVCATTGAPTPATTGASALVPVCSTNLPTPVLSPFCLTVIAFLQRLLLYLGIPVLLFAMVGYPQWLWCRRWILLSCLSVCSVVIVMSSFFPIRRLRCSVCCLMFLCWSLYCQGGAVSNRSTPQFGMPLPRVVSLEGRLIADSAVSAKGNQVLSLVVDRCGGKDGSIANCRGELMAVGKDVSLLLSGTRVVVHGSFMTGDDASSSDSLFLADSINVPLVDDDWDSRFGAIWRRFREVCIRRVSALIQGDTKTGWDADTIDKTEVKNGIDSPDVWNAKTLVLMLLLGRCDDPFFPLKELSRTCGCAHVLALSGMHLQFFTGIVAWFGVRLMGKRRGRLLALPPVLLFLCIAGPKPSLLRSGIMFLSSILPTAFGRERGTPAGAYVTAFILQLLLFPHTMVTAGCLFSYAALGGLLALSGYADALCSTLLPRRLSALWCASAVAMLWSAPCSLRVFGSWSPIGILLSPVVGVMIGLLMFLGMMMLCFGGASSVVYCCVVKAATILYRCLERMMQWGSDLSGRYPLASSSIGFVFYVVLLLTVSIAILYAGTVLRTRSIRRHELEICVRFPGGDHRFVG